ncbi:MAG: hypothetical protein AAB964_00465 [Patescibacteria group bacterium]
MENLLPNLTGVGVAALAVFLMARILTTSLSAQTRAVAALTEAIARLETRIEKSK